VLCTAWPTYCVNKLLLVRGLSSETKLEDLRPLFPRADEILVAKDKTKLFPNVGKRGKRKQNAAKAEGYDG